MVNELIKEVGGKMEMEMEDYVMEKLRLSEGGNNYISGLRRMYKDRDVGAKNWMLYKVKVGKVWYTKSSRKK